MILDFSTFFYCFCCCSCCSDCSSSDGNSVDPFDPGENILGSSIKFTVEVTPWEDAAQDVNM